VQFEVTECLLSIGAESFVFVLSFAYCLVWLCNLVARIERGSSYVVNVREWGREVDIMA